MYDWVEIKLQRLEETTDRWLSKAEIAGSVTSSVNNYNNALKAVGKSISANNSAYKRYKKQYQSVEKNALKQNTKKSTKVSDKTLKGYFKQVRTGKISISSIKNDEVREAVENYKTWYEKATKAKDAVNELKKEQKELVSQKLDSILNWYDAFIDRAKSWADYHETILDYNKAVGADTSSNKTYHYQEEKKDLGSSLSQQKAELSKYESEYKKSKKYLNSSEQAEYEKTIQELKTGIKETETSMAELDNQIREIRLDDLNRLADAAATATARLEKLASISTTHGDYQKESDLNAQINGNNAERTARLNTINELKSQMLNFKAGSTDYNDLKDQLNSELDAIKDLEESNEQLRQDIINLRFEQADRVIEDRNTRISDNQNLIDLMSDENLVDEDTGLLTTDGKTKLALLNDSIAQSQKNMVDYKTELSALEKLYTSGQIGEEAYTEKMNDIKQAIHDTASETKDLEQEMVSLGKDAMQAEFDALIKVIDKRKEALSRKKEYNDYDRNIKDQNKNLQALEAERAALEGVEGAATAAQRAKLDAQIDEAKNQLEQTKQDHSYDIQVQGYDDLTEKLQDSLDKQFKLLSSSLEEQAKLINKMLGNVADSFADVFTNINSVIANNGLSGSMTNGFTSDYSNQSTAQSTNSSNSSITNNVVNSNTSVNGTTNVSTGNNVSSNNINTGGITNTAVPSDTNRPMASFVLSWAGGNMNYLSSKTISVDKILPPDAVNQTFKWTTSNKSIVSISGSSGKSVTIKAAKIGKATVTCTSANGISRTAEVNVVYTKGQSYALKHGCTIGKKAKPSAATLATYSDLNKYLVGHGFDTLHNPDQMYKVGKSLGLITSKNSKKGGEFYKGKDGKYSKAQSNKILATLKKNGLRNGGIVDDFIPISELNATVKGNKDHGIATVRRDELLTSPEGTVHLLEAMRMSEQMLASVKQNNNFDGLTGTGTNYQIMYDALIKVESGGMIDKSVLNELKALVKTTFDEQQAIKLREYHKTGWKPKF